MLVHNTTIYFIYFKIVYRQGDMFRPSLGHPKALKENGSKTTQIFYKNALWDPKCSQNVLKVLYNVFYNLYSTFITFCEHLGSHNAFL